MSNIIDLDTLANVFGGGKPDPDCGDHKGWNNAPANAGGVAIPSIPCREGKTKGPNETNEKPWDPHLPRK